MKKNLHYFLFLIFLCSGLSAKQIDPGTASSIAKSFISGNTNLRTSGSPDLKLVYTSGNKIRTSGTTEKTNSYYYIFNIGNNQGFIIISADDINSPVLGYSTNGNYDPNNLPDNFKSWMRTIEKGMEEAISKRKTPSKEIQTEWENFKSGKSIYPKSTRAVVVTPLIKTTWNQNNPYNSEIPYNVVTGCVATATAQIMKYYNYPKSGTGTIPAYTVNNDNKTYSFPDINLSQYTYDWENMLNNYDYFGNYTPAQKKAVGLLMYHIGTSIKMNYSKTESGAQSRNAAKALFTYFKYDKSLEFRERYDYISDENNNNWDNMLRSELNNKRPIYYDGYGNGGHAFVCDGYDDQGFFHFNWGWGGYQDGYFKTTATLDYKNGQNVIINIKPDKGGITIPRLELSNGFTSISTIITSGKRGTKFTVNFSFKNVSLVPFEGYYGVALTDNSNNIKYILDQSGLSQLDSGYFYSSYGFKNCIIPIDAISGKYKLRMVAKYKDDTNWFIVTNPSSSVINHIPFEILDGSELAKLQIYGTTPITVSKNPATAGETVAVKLSFVNFSGIPFKGYYGIALTDNSNNIKYILNQSGLSQLGLNNYFPEYNFYNCIIPQNALPGKYKLRMVSKIEGKNDWTIVTSPTSSIIDQIPFEIISATRMLPTSLKTSIYPNPATNYLQIQSTEKVNKVLVYNLSGNIVLQVNGNESNKTISVANLNPGMYIVHIHTENGITKQNLIKE